MFPPAFECYVRSALQGPSCLPKIMKSKSSIKAIMGPVTSTSFFLMHTDVQDMVAVNIDLLYTYKRTS